MVIRFSSYIRLSYKRQDAGKGSGYARKSQMSVCTRSVAKFGHVTEDDATSFALHHSYRRCRLWT